MKPSKAARSSRSSWPHQSWNSGRDLVHRHRPEEVLQSAFGVGKAFHVEEDVVVRRRRQQGEPAAQLAGRWLAQLPERQGAAARGELERRLRLEPLEHGGRYPVDSAIGRATGEGIQRGDPVGLEPPHLAAADAGDLGQMVGLLEQFLRGAVPAAPGTIQSRMGHPGRSPRSLERDERALELAVVVEEVASRVLQLVALSQHEHQLGRAESPDRLQHLGVGAELDQEVRLGGAGELGVPRGVVVAAAGAGVAEAADRESRGSRASRLTARWAW